LLLNGHSDVVPTGDPDQWTDHPFGGQAREGRLYGRGACDMKAGLAAIVVAVRAIRQSGVRLRGDLLVASVQGEEDGGLGTFATLQRGWRADACVIAEPTELGIIPANSGALTFRLRIRGEATHAARRTEGVSSIDLFWPVYRAIQALETRRHREVAALPAGWRARYPLAHPISIGTVTAGDWASSVPDLLVAEGRMGVALDEPVAQARAALEAAVAEACEADNWLRSHPVEVEWWGGQFASGRLPEGSGLVEQVAAAHRHAAGIGAGDGTRANDDGERGGAAPSSFDHHAPDVYPAPYGSDLRLWTGLGGMPTVQYGPGDAALAHGPRESVSVAEMRHAARTFATLAINHCGIV
jgi:acetylornithine deacetylase